MTFTTDPFKLIQPLDTETLTFIKATTPPKLSREQYGKALKAGVVLDEIIECKARQNSSLMRFVKSAIDLNGGVFGSDAHQGKKDRDNCLSLIDSESDLLCGLRVLKTAVSQLLAYNQPEIDEKNGGKV